MLSLSDFSAPPEHEETIYEYDCHLVSSNLSQADLAIGDQNETFARWKVPEDLLRLCESKENCAKSAFMPGTVTTYGKLSSAWHQHGIMGLLQELSSCHENEILAKCGKHLTWLKKLFSALHGSINSYISLSNEEMISEFSSTNCWRKSPIRCLAWHPFISKYAVALNDDSICIETHGSNVKPILKYRSQKNVADLSWRPFSSSQLAVASQSSILIWTIDPSSLITRPSSSCVQVLAISGHGPVTSIAWSPIDGALLVSASPVDTSIVIWQVSTEEHVAIRRLGGGIPFIRWSPSGQNLFTATSSSLFRIWETDSWTCERWSNINGRCQAACWSPDGMDLLFTTTKQYSIFHVSLFGSKQAVPLVDLSQIEYIRDNCDVTVVGGRVHQLIWDECGERLAVSFTGADSACELIAIFRTRRKPSLEIFACGYVNGPTALAFPTYIAFKPSYNHGALLTACWSSGEVTHIPLKFIHSANLSALKYSSTSVLSPLHQTTIYSL